MPVWERKHSCLQNDRAIGCAAAYNWWDKKNGRDCGGTAGCRPDGAQHLTQGDWRHWDPGDAGKVRLWTNVIFFLYFSFFALARMLFENWILRTLSGFMMLQPVSSLLTPSGATFRQIKLESIWIYLLFSSCQLWELRVLPTFFLQDQFNDGETGEIDLEALALMLGVEKVTMKEHKILISVIIRWLRGSSGTSSAVSRELNHERSRDSALENCTATNQKIN